jgi:hypothetical protein
MIETLTPWALLLIAVGLVMAGLHWGRRVSPGTDKCILLALALAGGLNLLLGLAPRAGSELEPLTRLREPGFLIVCAIAALALVGELLAHRPRVARGALALGLVLSVAAMWALAGDERVWSLAGFLAAGAAGALAALLLDRRRKHDSRPNTLLPDSALLRRVLLASLILVTLLAKFHLFASTPPGFAVDEGAKARVAMDIAQGRLSWRPYFIYREAPYFYILAALIKLLGFSIPTLRLGSTLICLAGTVLYFLLWRRLFGFETAFVATLFLTGSLWHNNVSRVAQRLVLVPPLQLLVIDGVDRLLRRDRYRDYALVGALLAAGFYTYPPARVLPAFVALALIARLVRRRRGLKRLVAGSLLLSGVFLVVLAAPLGRDAPRWPDYFLSTKQLGYRIDPAAHSLAEMRKNFTTLLQTWHIQSAKRGTVRPINSRQPVLAATVALLFPLGLGLCLGRIHRREYALPLLAFFVGWIPGIVSWPFQRRLILATHLTYLFAALAAVEIARLVLAHRRRSTTTHRTLLMIGALTLCAVLNQQWQRLDRYLFQYTGYLPRYLPLRRAVELAETYDVYYVSHYFDRDSYIAIGHERQFEDLERLRRAVRPRSGPEFIPIRSRSDRPCAIVCQDPARFRMIKPKVEQYYPGALLERHESQREKRARYYVFLISPEAIAAARKRADAAAAKPRSQPKGRPDARRRPKGQGKP